jgi:predicted aconitase
LEFSSNLHLKQSEEKALAGEYGEALQIAYRVLLAIARLTDAKSFIPIDWAHVSGVSYLTIGDYGLDFLDRISSIKGTKFKVFTTVNPCGMDVEHWNDLNIPTEYAEKQLKIISCYERLGIASSFTCVPFQSYSVPKSGSHVAWAESSAAIYANSILGLKTNRESAVSALAAALTGKTVYSDLHLDENRKPTIALNVSLRRTDSPKGKIRGALSYGVLGYYAGKHTSGVVEFQGLGAKQTIGEQKALCAALGTLGSTGMFTLGKTKGIETIEFSNREYRETLEEISDSETGELIVFGCPQMTIEELYDLSKMLRGKHLAKPCVVFCSSKIYTLADKRGYTNIIQKAGAKFVRDACADFTPLISSLNVGSVLTDSVKGAHYMKRVHGVKTALLDTEQIVSINS